MQNKKKAYLKIDLLQMVVLELLLLLLLTDPKNFSELSLSTEPVKSVPTTMNQMQVNVKCVDHNLRVSDELTLNEISVRQFTLQLL